MTDSPVPRAARLLGLAGLLPSVAMLAVMLFLPEFRAMAAGAGATYGAVIASFIGGAWWGLAAMAPEHPRFARRLVMSVLPALIAWPALLVPPPAGLLVLAVLFAALLPTDCLLRAEGAAPAWWFALRWPLSAGMAVLHAAAALTLVLAGPF